VENDPEILPSLQDLLRAFVGPERKVDEDTDLIGDLGLTSLKVMDLLMEIEDRFDVTVPLNKLPEVRTVGDLAAMLDSLISRRDV
jgi:acyl carrier protein